VLEGAIDEIELRRVEMLIHPVKMHARLLEFLVCGEDPPMYLRAHDLEGAVYSSAREGLCSIDEAVGRDSTELRYRIVVKHNIGGQTLLP